MLTLILLLFPVSKVILIFIKKQNKTKTKKNKSKVQVEELMCWGEILGRFGGEQAALEAMERNEIREVPNPTRKGPSHLFEVYRVTGQ